MTDKSKVTWIDIDAPKKECAFKELEKESLDETPMQVEKKRKNEKEKEQVLEHTLFRAVNTLFPQVVSEAADSHKEQFFKGNDWNDFYRHAKMIASFIGTDDKKIDNVLKNMKRAFENLGGEEEGFKKINEIDRILMSGSGIGDVYPKITVKNFIDIALPNDVNVNGVEFRQQIMKFFDFVLTRNSRKLAPLLAKNGTFLGCLKSQLKGDKDAESIFTYFRKVVGMNNYKKHGGEVGKAEIALALFFGDCRLPDDNGDVVMEMKNGERKIEVKGSKAAITERTFLYRDLLNLKWKSLSKQVSQNRTTWHGLFPGLNSIEKMSDLSVEKLDELVKKILSGNKVNEGNLRSRKATQVIKNDQDDDEVESNAT